MNMDAVRDAEKKVLRPVLKAAGVDKKLKTAGLAGSNLVVTW